jgi:hypothetical protein
MEANHRGRRFEPGAVVADGLRERSVRLLLNTRRAFLEQAASSERNQELTDSTCRLQVYYSTRACRVSRKPKLGRSAFQLDSGIR